MEKVTQRIESPEEALERIRNTPGLTANQIQAAENWVANETRRRNEFGMGWVRHKRAEITTQSKELDRLIFEVNQHANDLKERLGKRELSDTSIGFKEARRLRNLLGEYEQQIAALATTHQTAEHVAEDPASYFHDFYNRWTALRHQVPTIEEAIYG